MKGDFCIGEWIVHPSLNSLERNGATIHLEPKIMQVLLTLASAPGEVFTREQIRDTIWPDIFVGEDVLIRAISEIRRAFSDEARSPHTVQTVPKVGYRLIAPVTLGALPESTDSICVNKQIEKEDLGDAISPVEELAPIAPSSFHKIASGRFWFLLTFALFVFVLIGAFIFVLTMNFKRSRLSAQYISHPLTTYPGSELTPAFSPDGKSIAFVWRKEGQRFDAIYTKFLNSEQPVPLTSIGNGNEYDPAWSPDGQSIAFILQRGNHSSIALIPSNGGSIENLYLFPVNSSWEYEGLTWTADGRDLIFPQQRSPEAPSQLVEFSLKKRTIKILTHPPQGWDGDWMPEVSPDGKYLAFVRGADRSARDLYVMRLPDGPIDQLSYVGHVIVGLAWLPDSSSIIFASNRGGSMSLWEIGRTGGVPQHVASVGSDAYSPAVSAQGHALVYAQGSATWGIYSIQLSGKRPHTSAILLSSEQDASPSVSPSGDMIAFQSWESGEQEIWTSNIDGSNPLELTTSNDSAGSPSWSPNGKLIAFDARPHSFAQIQVINASGGLPVMLTSGQHDNVVPNWSSDGRSLYFGSNHDGSWQIWKITPNHPKSLKQVTNQGGMIARESHDGNWLYISQYDHSGIWKLNLKHGGSERKIFEGPPAGYQDYWTVHGGYIYSLSLQGKHYEIDQVNPNTGMFKPIYVMRHDPAPFAGLSVTPDGRELIYAALQNASSNLIIVKHFP